MGDHTHGAAQSSLACASIHRELVKNQRRALFPYLPRLLATYFLQLQSKQPQNFSNWPCSEVHEGKSAPINEETSTITNTALHENKPCLKGQISMSCKEGMSKSSGANERDKPVLKDDANLPEELMVETIMQENLLRSLEGFFLWLDEEADEGKYKSVIEHDPVSWIDFLKEFLRQPIGSGIKGHPLNRMTCANCTTLRTCPYAASDDVACKYCWLVQYCSDECARAHESIHQENVCDYLVLNSDLSFPLQAMIMEAGRKCAAQRSTEDYNAVLCNPALPLYGLLHDSVLAPLIGTSPRSSSQDPADEGTSSSPQDHPHQHVLPDHVRLLFPALYDLRNVLITVCKIPDDYTGIITLFLNFAQGKLAIRDFLILELLRRHGAVAIDLAIGLWYSSAITAEQDTHLMLTIVRMLHTWQISLSAVGNQHSSGTYQQPFPHSTKGSSLQADFGMDIWSKLRELVCNDDCNRKEFNFEDQCHWDLNKNVKLKVDAHHRTHLVSWFNYERTGLLLPGGAPCAYINTPNRIRYSSSADRIERYTNDPVSGWDMRMLYSFLPARGVPAGDLYGVFFFHLREMMEVFVQKTESCCVQFRLMQFPVRKLFDILRNSGLKFNRIDACALEFNKEVSPEEAMQWCGGLLAKNASRKWPSLLLTATHRSWAEDNSEVYKEGKKIKEKLVSSPNHKNFFWKAVEPETLRAYVGLFEPGEFPGSSFDDKSQEDAAAQLGLHKLTKHRLVSPLPGISLDHCWKLTPTQAVEEYIDKEKLAYFNLVFSGFTFQERFHEWGWATGH